MKIKLKKILATALTGLLIGVSLPELKPKAATLSWIEMTGLNRSADYNAIAYGNCRFVTVGDCGKSAYSTDGETWNTMTGLSTFYDYSSIVYGNRRFVTLGSNYKMYYSADGETWNRVEGIDSSYNMNKVVYGENEFVAVGYDGKSYYSTNGQNWTEMTGLDSLTFTELLYGNGVFITRSGQNFYYSNDKKTWNKITFPNTYAKYNIAYGNGVFVIENKNGCMYSKNGVNWTNVTLNYYNYDSNTLKFNGKIFWLRRQTRKWVEATYKTEWVSGSGSTHPETVVDVPAHYSYTSYYYQSTDGQSWSKATGDYSLTYIDGGDYQYKYAGSSTTYYSADNGSTWTSLSNPVSRNAIVLGDGRLVEVGTGKSAYIGEYNPIPEDSTPPDVKITYDSSKYYKEIPIVITATDEDKNITVTFNGTQLTAESDGTYKYTIKNNGVYTIVAKDSANNTTTKTVKITNIDTSKPKITITVSDYSNGKAKVTIKATPQGGAKVKNYSYKPKNKIYKPKALDNIEENRSNTTLKIDNETYKSKNNIAASESDNDTEEDNITGSGDSIVLNVNDETYVEGSFDTETGAATTFTVDGYNIIIDEAIHEDNWLNKYVATQLDKEVKDLTIDDIESVTEVNVPNQGITEIPYSMKYMRSLETLDLSNNDLTEIPSFIENLENLKELNVSGNYNLNKTTIPTTPAKVYSSVISSVTSKDKVSTSGDINVIFSQANTIELTLSTNEIDFGDVNGLIESDDTTPEELVINVQSSLPYDLNINAESDFVGQTDNSNIIPIEKLQYNVDSNDYTSMTKDTAAIASDKAATLGNKDSYNLSFKLQPTIGYAKDNYKTNIKVIALQK